MRRLHLLEVMRATPTEAGGEGLQREVAVAAGVQGVKDVLQLLGRQGQLSVEPLGGGGEVVQSSVNPQHTLTVGSEITRCHHK